MITKLSEDDASLVMEAAACVKSTIDMFLTDGGHIEVLQHPIAKTPAKTWTGFFHTKTGGLRIISTFGNN